VSYDAWKTTVPEDREPLRRTERREPAPRTSLGWCHFCCYDEDEPRLTAATTTRPVPVGRDYQDVPACRECANAHDNAVERQGLARVNG
jgi:hypothetical protein